MYSYTITPGGSNVDSIVSQDQLISSVSLSPSVSDQSSPTYDDQISALAAAQAIAGPGDSILISVV